MLEKKLSNDKSPEVNVAISRKKFHGMNFDKKRLKMEWTKNLKTDSVQYEKRLRRSPNYEPVLFDECLIMK